MTLTKTFNFAIARKKSQQNAAYIFLQQPNFFLRLRNKGLGKSIDRTNGKKEKNNEQKIATETLDRKKSAKNSGQALALPGWMATHPTLHTPSTALPSVALE